MAVGAGCEPKGGELLIAGTKNTLSREAANRLSVTATDGKGLVGSGTVRLKSSVGSLSAGEEAALDKFGTAQFDFWCLVAEDPSCVGTSVEFTATWSTKPPVTGAATLKFGGATAGGGGGTGGGGLTYASNTFQGVVDAELSRSLDTLVLVRNSPNVVDLIDLASGQLSTIPLTFAPTAVSISPDGRSAAIGHNLHITIVDLVTKSEIAALNATCDVLDVVLAGNGWVYAFPRRDQWEPVHAIEVATGMEEVQGGSIDIFAGALARLHPSGTLIYTATNGLSPADIERFKISEGQVTSDWDSPYHGEYPMCGNLWFLDDGARILTRCGRVFRQGAIRSNDMTYDGALQNVSALVWADQGPAGSNNDFIAAIPAAGFSSKVPEDTSLQFFASNGLALDHEVKFPVWNTRTHAYYVNSMEPIRARGRFVFSRRDSKGFIALLQADPVLGLTADWRLWSPP